MSNRTPIGAGKKIINISLDALRQFIAVCIHSWPIIVVLFVVLSILTYQRYLFRFGISSSITSIPLALLNAICIGALIYAVSEGMSSTEWSLREAISVCVLLIVSSITFLLASSEDYAVKKIKNGTVARYTVNFDGGGDEKCVAIIDNNSEFLYLWQYSSMSAISYSREKIVSIKQSLKPPPPPTMTGHRRMTPKLNSETKEWADQLKSICDQDVEWGFGVEYKNQ
jgi:hypothetical protein